ncbi:N-acetyltaurine hydrolase isoform X2 [Caretta caretta]|uniref:N-acetyltaurine hydrolase isoform X2 n=1 Tax=Caretta caretta TaxID=8467 RepID=UPI003F4BD009
MRKGQRKAAPGGAAPLQGAGHPVQWALPALLLRQGATWSASPLQGTGSQWLAAAGDARPWRLPKHVTGRAPPQPLPGGPSWGAGARAGEAKPRAGKAEQKVGGRGRVGGPAGLTDIIVNEILRGADGTDIKCGVVGEIGCSWPLTESENKVLQATAHAQSQLGCPIIIHPGRNSDAPFQSIRILQEAGADISKTVMSHLDRTIFDEKKLLEFAKLGCYLEYDLFGTELLHYHFHPDIDMPSDNERIARIRMLIDEGYEDRIVIAHDVHTKNRLMKYGGHGYSHILKNIVPKMLIRGISQNIIDKILIENPKQWLTFK